MSLHFWTIAAAKVAENEGGWPLPAYGTATSRVPVWANLPRK